MKSAISAQTLPDQLECLRRMEAPVARELPIFAGSVLYAPLRVWLSRRAMQARVRHDLLEQLLRHHAHPHATRRRDPIRSILSEGNRELARIRHPYLRDVAMIEHCIRIEQHAKAAYGIAVPLIHRLGFPRTSRKLNRLLEDLEMARHSFKELEEVVAAMAACHSSTSTDAV